MASKKNNSCSGAGERRVGDADRLRETVPVRGSGVLRRSRDWFLELSAPSHVGPLDFLRFRGFRFDFCDGGSSWLRETTGISPSDNISIGSGGGEDTVRSMISGIVMADDHSGEVHKKV